MNAWQRAHERLMQTLPVRTHLSPAHIETRGKDSPLAKRRSKKGLEFTLKRRPKK